MAPIVDRAMADPAGIYCGITAVLFHDPQKTWHGSNCDERLKTRRGAEKLARQKAMPSLAFR